MLNGSPGETQQEAKSVLDKKWSKTKVRVEGGGWMVYYKARFALVFALKYTDENYGWGIFVMLRTYKIIIRECFECCSHALCVKNRWQCVNQLVVDCYLRLLASKCMDQVASLK